MSSNQVRAANARINHQVIRRALLGFLELLESTDKQASIEILELWLGQLAFLQHFIGDIPDAGSEYSKLLAGDLMRWRKLIGEQFPGLGDYNLPAAVSEQAGASEILIGNPVNDLADIAGEISECLRRWENIGENNALWYLRFGYQAHWGAHLRDLQTYLHDLPFKDRNKTARR